MTETEKKEIDEFRDVLAETDEILNCFPPELRTRVSAKLLKFISEYKNKERNFEFKGTLDDEEIHYDTKIFLSLIYRDYFCSPEKRQQLIEEDEVKIRAEKNKNMFSSNKEEEKVEEEKKEEPKELIEEEKKPWYKRILIKIRDWLTNKIDE